MVHNSKIKRISLAVCLALTPLAVNAAGLGRLTVLSGLGEPFNAEIELSATKDELSSLSAKIAPADAYTEQGLQRPAVLNTIHLELGKQPSGIPVLKLSSVQPVEDPFLDMLVQVEWSNGRLLREYTALLDPPGYGDRPVATELAPATAAAAVAPEKSGRKGGAASKTSKAGEVQSEEYKTHKGDTLRGIAKQMQVEGVSLEQMLVGLYRANDDAFVHGNMNRLKTGQIIRVPSSEELQGVSQQEAVKEIRIHTSDWNAYRQKLAGAVAESQGMADAAQGQSASGKITSSADDKSAPVPAGPRDVVKLTRTESAQKAGGAESAASKEDAVAREMAKKEADARVATLEKQVQDMQKLLEVKNQNLAELQKGKPGAPIAAQPQQAPQQPVVAEAKPTETQPVPVQPEAQSASAEVKQEVADKPKKPRRRMPDAVPASTEAPDLLQDPLLLSSAGGGLIALLAGAWLYLRSKRRKGLDSFERAILSGSTSKTNTVFGSTTGNVVDTGDTSFLTDLTQGTGGMIDTNDVDPIAEAEVYMAYGRDAQAEEILKDAVSKDPTRYELQQKLLEIYAGRKDTGAFETLASELYATLGSEDPVWAKCAAIGHELEPGNPLYQTGHSEAVQASTTQPGIETANVAEPAPEEHLETGAEPGFDLGDHALGEAEVAIGSATETAPVTPMVAELPPAVTEAGGLDFELELPEPALEDNVQLGATELGMVSGDVVPGGDETVAERLQPQTSAEIDVPVELASSLAGGALELPESEARPVALEPLGELPDIVPEAKVDVGSGEVHGDELPEIEFLSPQDTAKETGADQVLADQSGEEVIPTLDTLTLELPSLDLDEGSPQQPIETTELPELPDDAATEEIVLETLTAEDADLDFNFDAEMQAAATELPQVTEPPVALPDLDLSSISLDLDEPEPVAEPVSPVAPIEAASPEGAGVVEEITLAESEQADVDTKLDLVAAYLDMGDTEGARELLEEVLHEGGPQQRQRAQSLLDTLG